MCWGGGSRWWGMGGAGVGVMCTRMGHRGVITLCRDLREARWIAGSSPAMTAWIEWCGSRRPGEYWIVRRRPARTMTASRLGDVRVETSASVAATLPNALPPTPNPSPQGGGEQTECAATVVISERESRRTKQDRGPPGGVLVIAFIPREAQRGLGGAPTGARFRLSRLRDATIRACEARCVPGRGKPMAEIVERFQC
jgi:hypothetical protein